MCMTSIGRWCLLIVLISGGWTIQTVNPPVHAASLRSSGVSVYIDPVLGSDTLGTGSQASPWRTITHAISHVSAGDTIRLAAGNYSPGSGEQFPLRLPVDVNLIGAGADASIISGHSNATVLYVAGATHSLIQDVQLTHGATGLYVYSLVGSPSAPEVTRVRIQANRVGVVLKNFGVAQSDIQTSPRLIETDIAFNSSDGLQVLVNEYSGIGSQTPLIVSSTLRYNGGYGLYVQATGASGSAELHLTATDLTYNGQDGLHATTTGGGWIKLILEHGRLTDNQAAGAAWLGDGRITGQISNSLFAHNRGGVYLGTAQGSSPDTLSIINSTFSNNRDYGLYLRNDGPIAVVSVSNTILWNLGADDLQGWPSDVWTIGQISHSVIEDGDLAGQTGNLAVDPLLIDDYHLDPCSPAIDAGDAGHILPIDLDGDSRPIGSGPDMGADEVTGACWLQSTLAVSSLQMKPQTPYTYTAQLTNTHPANELPVVFTATLPADLKYYSGTLQFSSGLANYAAGQIGWSGTLTVGQSVTISFQTGAQAGDRWLSLTGRATAEGYGTFLSASPKTWIERFVTCLPTVLNDFCGGFFDDFSTSLSGWPVGEDAYVRAQYMNGEYQLLSKVGGYLYGFASPACGQELYRVEVDARWADAAVSGDGYAVLFDITPDFSRYGVFYVSADYGDFALNYRDAAGVHQVVPFTPSAAIKQGAASNHLTVIRRADSVTLLVNGVTLGTWGYPAVTGVTRAGVAMQPYGSRPQADARFDNFAVYRLTAGTVASSVNPTSVAPIVSTSPVVRGFAAEAWRHRAWSGRSPLGRSEH